VLATQAASNFGSEAAEHLVCGVYHKPLALHLMWLGGKRFHVCAVLKKLGADLRKPWSVTIGERTVNHQIGDRANTQAKKNAAR
jgi:hypothetical protein